MEYSRKSNKHKSPEMGTVWGAPGRPRGWWVGEDTRAETVGLNLEGLVRHGKILEISPSVMGNMGTVSRGVT